MNKLTNLDKAISEANSISFWGQLSSASQDELLLAAKRVQELEKENERLTILDKSVNNLIETARAQRDELRTEYKKALKALTELRNACMNYGLEAPATVFLNVGTALSTPLAIETMKENKI